MNNQTGIITEIQRFSLHDGPGIRTTVFLKGCPLHCEWCHNPECISFETQEMFYPEKCIGCGDCSKGCLSGARVTCGKEMSVDEVLAEALHDEPYYRENGGVTISGGEPLAQRDFTLALLQKCRESSINTAIETCLYRYDEEVLEACDLIISDLKLWDDSLHKAYTGFSNAAIIDNLKRLDALGVPYVVRTPVIPDVTDTDEIVAFVKGLKNVKEHELLTYHPLGISKSKALGLEQKRFDGS